MDAERILCNYYPVRFFHPDADEPITYTFAIIASLYEGKWIWVRKKGFDSWELPAGHVEPDEQVVDAAKRELFEETGALNYSLEPVVSYEGTWKGRNIFGGIFLARITELGVLPDYEIAEIAFFERIPKTLTYPGMQQVFFEYVLKNTSWQS